MYLNKLLILKKLQEANTHLGAVGAKSSKWVRFSAQRTQSYILGFRGAQPILDLDRTIISLRRACNVIQLIIRSNGHLLFINTNPKYNKIIQQTAMQTNQSFINHKWIGGFLTNWDHMRNVQQQFKAAARLNNSPSPEPLGPHTPKGEGPVGPSPAFGSSKSNFEIFRASCLGVAARYKKMQSLRGLAVPSPVGPLKRPRRDEGAGPDCVIIFNANQNSTAIYEAHLNQIPIISLVDSDIPNDLQYLITYPIPSNYESVQFIYLFCNCILKTILISQ